MKKIYLVIASIILSLASIFTIGCGGNDNNTIRLSEVTHSIFYAPLYIAINKGYFEEEGLKIELTNGGGADSCMTAILSGNADIGLFGPEATIYVKDGGAKDNAVIFGQLTKRDGSFLVSKTPTNNFSWSDLVGKTVIGGRAGGVPALTLEHTMKNNGLTPGAQIDSTHNVKLRTDVAFNLTAPTFTETEADYCTLFEPVASQIVAEGKGHIVASIGEYSGEIPYTAFTAKRSFLKSNNQKAKKFLKAVMKGYEYLTTANIDEVVDAIYPSFSTTDKATIKSSLQRYISIDAWMDTPVMKESAYNTLHSIIKNAGLINNDVAFSSVVDNSIAEELVASLSK